MNPRHLAVAAAALLGLASMSTTASAQQMKPGLWEITNRMQSQGGQMDNQMSQMQQQMAHMSAEQRKMVEDMMARQGMQVGRGGPGGMTVKICMTKEMVERNELPSQRGDCKTTQQQRNGNTMTMAFTCTNPPSSGEGQVTFASPESYTMKMVVNSQVDGQAQRMNMDATGKWLSSDCGNVKPMTAPRK